MITYPQTIKRLQTELDELRSLRAEIQAEGATAPAKYTIDSSTNAKGVTYHRLREGKNLVKSLGKGGDDLAEWRDRIRRRNAIQQVDSHAMQIRKLVDALSKGIDYELQSEAPPLELDQARYIEPGAA